MSKRIVLSCTDREYLLLKKAYLQDSSTDSDAPASLARWCKRKLQTSIGEAPGELIK